MLGATRAATHCKEQRGEASPALQALLATAQRLGGCEKGKNYMCEKFTTTKNGFAPGHQALQAQKAVTLQNAAQAG